MAFLRRLTAGLLALALALLSGCDAVAEPASGGVSLAPSSEEGGGTAAPETLSSVRIPYDPEDGLNPYTCQGLQNYYAAGLLYDTLVALDSVGTPQNRLAQEVTFDGNLCIVKLRTDGRFTDGSPVTAQDVAYSALTARETPRFAPGLAGVLEVSAPDQYTVVFSLLTPDRYFEIGRASCRGRVVCWV